MAFGAVTPARSLVSIVFGVTGNTGSGWLPDCIIRAMASGTCRARMLAQQGEASIASVIERRRFPACG